MSCAFLELVLQYDHAGNNTGFSAEEMLLQADEAGKLPIHHLCSSKRAGAAWKQLRSMIDMVPESIETCDSSKSYSIDMCLDNKSVSSKMKIQLVNIHMQHAVGTFLKRFEVEEEKNLSKTASAILRKKAEALAASEGTTIEIAEGQMREKERELKKEAAKAKGGQEVLDLTKYPDLAFPLGDTKVMVKRAFKYLFTSKKAEGSMLKLLLAPMMNQNWCEQLMRLVLNSRGNILTVDRKIEFYNMVPSALLSDNKKGGADGGEDGGGMMHWVMGGGSVSENSVKMMIKVDPKSVRHPDKEGML
jgi:hypothetical protein